MDSSQHWKQINDDQLLSLRIRIRGVKILLKEMKRIVVSCKILSQQETVAQEVSFFILFSFFFIFIFHFFHYFFIFLFFLLTFIFFFFFSTLSYF
mgnify:CR=1 FL=1